MKDLSRRDMLLALRAAAVGLPLGFLKQPLAYAADACAPALPDPSSSPDFLLMSLSVAGDPLNANCPGSYVSGVYNNPHPDLAPTSLRLGSVSTTAAAPWAALPSGLLSRTSFLHVATTAVSHNQFDSVVKLNGAAKNAEGRGAETLPALIAGETASLLGTVQSEPIALAPDPISVRGMPVSYVKPSDMVALFQPKTSALADLGALRDTTIDAIHAQLRARGTRAQRAFLDRYAVGRTQARNLGDCIGSLLSRLPVDPESDGPEDQVLTAIVMFKLKVTPVVTVSVKFGEDNHHDPGFDVEADETKAGVGALGFMWSELVNAGLADHVTFANLNTFGRTLRQSDEGRSHNPAHHVMTVTSRRIRAGIVGGVGPVGKDFGAVRFSSNSGLPDSSGDITPDISLQSAAKTLAAAVGVPRDRIATRITGGSVITGALV